MILASFAFQRAPNRAEPEPVIGSAKGAGGINGAIGGCGMRLGGNAGGAEPDGRI